MAKKETVTEVEMLLVGSKTKAALKEHGVNVAGDALDGLNMIVHWHIEQAAKRAQANGRKTVRGHDIILG
jgi:histone H3/H4